MLFGVEMLLITFNRLFLSVSRSASASGGGRGVCRLHVELERERLPDSAGAAVSGHEQSIHQGNISFSIF